MIIAGKTSVREKNKEKRDKKQRRNIQASFPPTRDDIDRRLVSRETDHQEER